MDEYDNDDYQEQGEKSQDYSFPMFGTGGSSRNNNDVNLNGNENQDLNNNVNNQNVNTPKNTPNNNSVPSSNGLSPQNNSGLTSGNKDDNKSNNGPDLNKNNNSNKPVANPNQEGKDSDSKNNKKDDDKNKDNKDSKDNKDNNKDNKSGDKKDDSSSSKKISPKNIAKKAGLNILNKAGQGVKNTANNLQGEDAPDNNEVTDAISSGVRTTSRIIMLIITHPILALILLLILIIVIALFLILLTTVTTGSMFGAKKYGGWYCNMYSPTTSSNPGEISSFYTWRIKNGAEDPHTGVDIAYSSKGAEVLATHDGVVAETNYEDEGNVNNPYGAYIKIDDPDEKDDKKYRSYYAHLCSLEDEEELEASCKRGEYTGCDDKCRENEDGTFTYIWSCGPSKSALVSVTKKLKVGTSVSKGDVIGYVSDTGTRSKACDFHLHFESQSDKNYDDPDKGYVPEDINRYFNIEDASFGCDPIRSSGDQATPYDKIIKWECEKPILITNKDDEIFNYCDKEEPITPEENRFKGQIGIKNDDGEYIFTNSPGTYSSKLCGYEPKPPDLGEIGQCAAGVSHYLESFLAKGDPEAWNKFVTMKTTGSADENRISQGCARTYWEGNELLNQTGDGFASGQTPKVGSIWCSSDSSVVDDSTGIPFGHVMFVTGIEGENVHVYECNGFTKKECGYYSYTQSKLSSEDGFEGYIYIMDDEACKEEQSNGEQSNEEQN